MPSPREVYIAVIGTISFNYPSFIYRFLTTDQALEE
jgi:hypothetical protein